MEGVLHGNLGVSSGKARGQPKQSSLPLLVGHGIGEGNKEWSVPLKHQEWGKEEYRSGFLRKEDVEGWTEV